MGPESRQAVAELSRLRQEVWEDRKALADQIAEMREAAPRLEERPWASHAAVAVHAWYTALEAALERIVRTLDGDVPTGDRWHRDLLSQAAVEVPGVRPAIVPRDVLPDLLELLAFRHFFRHAYGAPMEPERLRDQIERVERVTPTADEGFESLDAHVEATIEALRGGTESG